MSSKYADEGTIAHALAAMCLETGKPAKAFIGRLIDSEDYEHASLSPSGAHRWMRCAGSHALETRIEFKPRKFSMEVTEDMAEGVQIYLDNLMKYEPAMSHGGAWLLVERKLPVGHITGEEGATGSGDAVILDFAALEIQVHDLKFGRGVEVSAEKNEQLALYLLGALEDFGEFFDWKTFRGVIHQPRISPTPDEYVWTREELLEFAEEAKTAARRATEAREECDTDRETWESENLVPGEKQCRFCDAKATCPAVARAVSETVIAEFVDLDKTFPPVNTIQPRPITQQDLTPIPADNARLAKYVALVPLIEGWCSHIKAHAEAELLAGRPVPGFKLVRGKRGNRAWKDENEAANVLHSMRLRKDEMYDMKLISPTKAEKVVGEKQWARLAPLIGQADGKPTVVPEDDKRPALEVKPVEQEFPLLTSPEELV